MPLEGIEIMTQTAEILAWLKREPITPRDAMSFGCYRLAARIKELRDQGWPIETEMEPHEGGKHARYRLRTKKPHRKAGLDRPRGMR